MKCGTDEMTCRCRRQETGLIILVCAEVCGGVLCACVPYAVCLVRCCLRYAVWHACCACACVPCAVGLPACCAPEISELSSTTGASTSPSKTFRNTSPSAPPSSSFSASAVSPSFGRYLHEGGCAGAGVWWSDRAPCHCDARAGTPRQLLVAAAAAAAWGPRYCCSCSRVLAAAARAAAGARS